MEDKYEYLLNVWGGMFNEENLKLHSEKEGYYWFDTSKKREVFLKRLQRIANSLNLGLVYAKKEGFKMRYETWIKAKVLYENIMYDLSYNFGYGFPEDVAIFNFENGNYSCDCNLSSFLREQYGEVIPDLPCGHKIELLGITSILIKNE